MCKDTKKFTIKQFREQFSDENKCLDRVYRLVYGDQHKCETCNSVNTYKKITDRRAYQCSKCRTQVYPTNGTIFEKTTTPLTYWFFAIMLFTNSKNGISAKELERQLGVTYKTAWRMLKQIRMLLEDGNDNYLSGTIEMDETFVGGKNKNRHFNKRAKYGKDIPIKDKVTVLGMYQRNGLVNAYAVVDRTANTLLPIIHDKIELGSTLITDEFSSYKSLKDHFNHEVINHKAYQYTKGTATTNRIENFWSILKRTINGSYIHVSRKYIQSYINECVFRFNNRDNTMFETMLSYVSLLSSSKPSQTYLY